VDAVEAVWSLLLLRDEASVPSHVQLCLAPEARNVAVLNAHFIVYLETVYLFVPQRHLDRARIVGQDRVRDSASFAEAGLDLSRFSFFDDSAFHIDSSHPRLQFDYLHGKSLT